MPVLQNKIDFACSPQKTDREGRMMPSAPLRRFPDLSAFGSRFGSCEKRQNAASLLLPPSRAPRPAERGFAF